MGPSHERVVVTGIGVMSPLGNSVEELWSAQIEGRSGITLLEDEEYRGLKSRIGGLAKNFDPDAHFDRKELRRMSRASQLAVIAAHQAIDQSGIKKGGVDVREVGVMIGSSIGGFQASDHYYRDFYRTGRMGPMVIPKAMNHGPSSNVSIVFGFEGPLLNVDAACASAANSIGHAWHLIRSRTTDVIVTGGADSPFARAVIEAWCAMRALSVRNDDPATACRPFSADRDGFVLSEGAGILVLESETSALRRGAPILAEIRGYGATGDSSHLTQPAAEGPIRAMKKTLDVAGLEPRQINFINAHGTGTPRNDANETTAIKEVFGARAAQIPVVANKSGLGHSIAASGAIEAISSILSIRNSLLPPTINWRVFDPECDLDYVKAGARRHEIEHCLSNSFAFGGSNAVLAISRYVQQ